MKYGVVSLIFSLFLLREEISRFVNLQYFLSQVNDGIKKLQIPNEKTGVLTGS